MVLNYRGRLLYAHRVAAALMLGRLLREDEQVDHLNGNPADNRWINLRIVTNPVNMHNQWGARRNSQSGLRGAAPHASGKWSAQIRRDWKIFYLGLFETPELAHEAYLRAKRVLHPTAPHELQEGGAMFIDITPLGASFHRRLEKIFSDQLLRGE